MAVHFIYVVPFMDKIMAIIRPFISKDMFLKVGLKTGKFLLF